MVYGDVDDGYLVFVDVLVNMCYILVWVVVIGVVCFELVEWIIEIVWVILFIMCIWVWLLSEVGVLD